MKQSKTFGEYLVECGQISQEDLLSAWISQVKSMPTVCEVVFQEKLVPASELVNALSLQARKKIDFIAACKELGCWSEAVERSVWETLERSQMPVVQALIDQKALEPAQLTKSLDSYLMEATSVVQSNEQITEQASCAQPMESVADSGADAGAPFSEAVLEFGLQFCEPLKQDLEEQLKQLENPETRKQVTETFRRLAGVAKSAQLSKLSRIFESLENLINAPSAVGNAGIAESIRRALDAAWSLRQFVLDAGSEGGFERANAAVCQELASFTVQQGKQEP